MYNNIQQRCPGNDRINSRFIIALSLSRFCRIIACATDRIQPDIHRFEFQSFPLRTRAPVIHPPSVRPWKHYYARTYNMRVKRFSVFRLVKSSDFIGTLCRLLKLYNIHIHKYIFAERFRRPLRFTAPRL